LNIEIRGRIGPETFRETFRAEIEKSPLAVGPNAASPHTIWVFQNPAEENGDFEIGVELSHFAVDGSGLAPVMHEVLQYTLLDIPPPPYGQWPMTQQHGLSETFNRSFTWVNKEFQKLKALLYVVYLAFSKEHVNLARNDSIKEKDYGKLNSTCCICDTLNPEETELLVAKCRQKKVSVTAAVSAAYLETCAQMKEEELKSNKLFRAILIILADSRKLATPPVPATDLAPHVYALPSFASKPKVWTNEQNLEDTWELANDIKEYIRSYAAYPMKSAFYAELIAFFLKQQPTKQTVPLVNVSSWCVNGPVLPKYGRYDVADVELLQNMAFHSWFNISMYTFLGKLHVSLFAPVPRFQEDLIRTLAKRSGDKVRAMLSSTS
jgi:hypothetical protein